MHFESYVIHDDDVGERFARALIARARDGVRVRIIYDWMGGFGKTSRRFWNELRAGRVVATSPNLAGLFRVDQLVAAASRR